MSPQIPLAEVQPLLRVSDVVGLIPGLGRSAVYEAVSRGQIPSLRVGSRLFVPTAGLRRLLGLDP